MALHPFSTPRNVYPKVVNPEMLRSRNIYFSSFDEVASSHISVLKTYYLFFLMVAVVMATCL